MSESSSAYEAGYAIGGLFGCLMMILLPVLFIVSLILAIVKKSKGWTIAAVLTGLLGLGLVGTGVFFAVKGAKEISEQAKIGKTVVGPQDKFSLTAPGNWREQNLGSEDASLQLGNLIREEYLIVIHEPISDFDPDFSIQDFADLASGGIVDALEDSSRGELVPIEINGMPAIECRVEGSADGIRIAYLNAYIQGENDFYQVMTWTLPSKEEAAFPVFREAIATFQEGVPEMDDAAAAAP